MRDFMAHVVFMNKLKGPSNTINQIRYIFDKKIIRYDF